MNSKRLRRHQAYYRRAKKLSRSYSLATLYLALRNAYLACLSYDGSSTGRGYRTPLLEEAFGIRTGYSVELDEPEGWFEFTSSFGQRDLFNLTRPYWDIEEENELRTYLKARVALALGIYREAISQNNRLLPPPRSAQNYAEAAMADFKSRQKIQSEKELSSNRMYRGIQIDHIVGDYSRAAKDYLLALLNLRFPVNHVGYNVPVVTMFEKEFPNVEVPAAFKEIAAKADEKELEEYAHYYIHNGAVNRREEDIQVLIDFCLSLHELWSDALRDKGSIE